MTVVAPTCLSLSVLSLPLLLGALASAQELVGVNIVGDVFTVDSNSGVGQKVGNLGLGANHNAMGVSPSGDLYISQNLWSSVPICRILKIQSVVPPTASIVAQLPAEIRGMAFDGAGQCYGIVDDSDTSSGADELVAIDLAQETVVTIGSTGRTGIQGFAISPAGVFYAWDCGDISVSDLGAGLAIIDPGTGLATDVNPAIGPVGGAKVQFLTFRSDGALLGGRDSLYGIDPASGAFTEIGGSGFSDLRGADIPMECIHSYGTACPGSGGFVPSLGPAGCPSGGSLFALAIDGGLGGSTALLVLGLNEANVPLGSGCFLNVAPVLPVQLMIPLGGSGPGAGSSNLVAPVPASASGFSFTLQAIVADPGVANGYSTTRGLRIDIL